MKAVRTFTLCTVARLLLGLSLLAEIAWSAPVIVDATTLAQLAGETSQHVPEIRRARARVASEGADLATYGGTSRELLTFVSRKLDELGSADAYRAWLKKRGSLSLFDWHRANSDLDLMLIPKNRAEQTELSPERKPTFLGLVDSLQTEFPPGVFFSKLDVTIAPYFFARFGPTLDHPEFISNIALTEHGVVSIPQLEVTIDGKKVNLGREGLAQFQKRELDYHMRSRAQRPTGFRESAFSNFLKVLRWIRYAAEQPELELPPHSRLAIEALMREIDETGQRPQVIELLRDGNRQRLSGHRSGESVKLIESLLKLQIYSGDSPRTRALLEEFGVRKIAQEAEIDRLWIYDPLPLTAPANAVGHERLGKKTLVYHRTRSLGTAQNMRSGALWISNGTSIFGEKSSAAVRGPGLYTSTSPESHLDYGDVMIGFELSPDAIIGRDVAIHPDGVYVIQSQAAIARDSRGRLMISGIDRESYLATQLQAFRNGIDSTSPEALASARMVGILLSGSLEPKDHDLLLKFLRIAPPGPLREALSSGYFRTAESLQDTLLGRSPFQAELKALVLTELIGDGTNVTSAVSLRAMILAIENPEELGHLIPKFEAKAKNCLNLPKDVEGNIAAPLASRERSRWLRDRYPSLWKSLLKHVLNFRSTQLAWDLRDPWDREVLHQLLSAKDPELVLWERTSERLREKLWLADPVLYLSEFKRLEGVPLRKNDPIDSDPILSEAVRKLLGFEPLKSFELAWFFHYLEGCDADLLRELLDIPRARPLILQRLKRVDLLAVNAIALLRGHDVPKVRWLMAEIEADPRWKARIRRYPLTGQSSLELTDNFGLSPKDPEDARILKTLEPEFLGPGYPETRWQSDAEVLLRKIEKAGGPAFPASESLWNTQKLDGNSIPDLALRQAYHALYTRKRRILAARGALQDALNRDPLAFKAIVPDAYAKITHEISLKEEEDHVWKLQRTIAKDGSESVLARFGRDGWKGLSHEESADIQRLLDFPVNDAAFYAYKGIFETGGPGVQILLDRIRKLRVEDDVAKIAQEVEYKPAGPYLRELLRDAKIRARFLDRMTDKLGSASNWALQGFPWDPARSEDQAAFEKILKDVIPDTESRVAELVGRFRQRDPKGYYHVGDLKVAAVLDDGEREYAAQLNQSRMARGHAKLVAEKLGTDALRRFEAHCLGTTLSREIGP